MISYDPLKIYFYNEGLVRFATVKYDLKSENLDKKMIHLTNYTLNKNGENFVSNEQADEDGVGSKWSLSALKRKYKLLEIDYDALMVKIKDLIIKTIIAAQPHVLERMKT